jgi:23S rRNA U2552 (ribose-2'-O)-methylase RlmE/FtsJ
LTRQDLKKAAGGNSMDVVLHDGAPNVGGAWSSEAYQQSWLVLEALKLATEFLAPRGTFVTKVFRCLFIAHSEACCYQCAAKSPRCYPVSYL